MASKTPKLLVTIDEKKRAQCEREIRGLLKAIGVRDPAFVSGAPQGLVEVSFSEDPKTVVARLTELCVSNPASFKGTYHWTPVEAWSETDQKHLAQYMRQFDQQIRPQESWRIEVHKNNSPVSARKITDAVAEFIQSPKVDLEAPDKTIHVELVGQKAGLSLLGPDDRLDVHFVANGGLAVFEEIEGRPRGGPKPR